MFTHFFPLLKLYGLNFEKLFTKLKTCDIIAISVDFIERNDIKMTRHKMSVSKFFLISYITVAAIPILISFIVNSRMFGIINSYNNERYTGILSQAVQNSNLYLDGIQKIPQIIISNPISNKYLSYDIYNKGSEDYDPDTLSKTIATVKTILSTDVMLEDICFFSTKNDTFMNKETLINAPVLYGDFFNFGTKDFNEFKSTVLNVPSYNKVFPERKITLSGIKLDCFFYLTTAPFFDRDSVSGGIIVSVNKKKFLDSVEKNFPLNTGFFYFYEGNELIVKSVGAPNIERFVVNESTVETVDGTDYLIYRTPVQNARSYAIAVPYAAAMKGPVELRNMVYLLMGGLLLFCAAAAYYFTRLNTKPLKNILNASKTYSDISVKNEYDIISSAMNNLITSDTNLRKESEKNRPILISDFLKSILLGNLVDSNEIKKRLNHLELKIASDNYRLINILLIANDGEFTDVAAAEFLNKISSDFTNLYTTLSQNNLIFVLCFDNDNEDIIYEIEKCINSVHLPESIIPKVAMSSIYHSLSDSFFAYQETKDFLDYGIQTAYKNVIWYVKNPITSSPFYYPIEIEMRILTSFKNKNTKAICETLDIIYEENAKKRILTSNNFTYLCFGIKGTIFKILDKYTFGPEHLKKTENQLKGLDNKINLNEFIGLVKNIFLDLLTAITIDGSSDIQKSLLEFIDKNYSDPSLSRQSFSEHFNISEDYVSKFFKEHTGFNFTEYVIKVRMDNACRLLASYDYTIDKISKAVGYNSDTSFRRAFKTYTGLSPKEYKKIK